MVQILFDSNIEFYSILLAVAAWLFVVVRTGEKPSTKIGAYVDATRQLIVDFNGLVLTWFGKTGKIEMIPQPEVKTSLDEIKEMLTLQTHEFALLRSDLLNLTDRVCLLEDLIKPDPQ